MIEETKLDEISVSVAIMIGLCLGQIARIVAVVFGGAV